MNHIRDRRRYRALLRAWPREHRDRYGAEMEEAFLALLRMDRARHGALGSVRCWLGAGTDAVLRGLGSRVSWTTTGGDVMGSTVSDSTYGSALEPSKT